MDTNFDIKLYRERWKAIEEVERVMLDGSGSKKYSLIKRFLISFDVLHDNDVDQMQIMLRWAKLKDIYEQKQLNSLK
jgi:hypothetical protein